MTTKDEIRAALDVHRNRGLMDDPDRVGFTVKCSCGWTGKVHHTTHLADVIAALLPAETETVEWGGSNRGTRPPDQSPIKEDRTGSNRPTPSLGSATTRLPHPHHLRAQAQPMGGHMSTYVPERGYWLGPILSIGEDPWPPFWEQNPESDECGHQWERVIVRRRDTNPEPVIRCHHCHTPRCGHSGDHDPCMERRHHCGLHITLHGTFEPVGGYLTTEEA